MDLHYEVDGPADRPPVLLINALGTTLELWSPQVAAWAGRFRVLRYDARGHGRSAVPAGEYTLDDLGQDALRVLDAAGVETAHVCGISLGGLTAMWMGVHRPDRVRSLVIADTAARVGTPDRWVERAERVRREGMAPIADLNMSNWFTPAFRAREPETVARFHRMLAGCNPDGYAGCCAALREADLRSAIGGVRAPALVVAGAHDPSTPVRDAQQVATAIPGATLLVLPAAHLTSVECAGAVSRYLEAFWSI